VGCLDPGDEEQRERQQGKRKYLYEEGHEKERRSAYIP